MKRIAYQILFAQDIEAADNCIVLFSLRPEECTQVPPDMGHAISDGTSSRRCIPFLLKEIVSGRTFVVAGR